MTGVRLALAALLSLTPCLDAAAASPFELLCSFTRTGVFQPDTTLVIGPDGSLIGAAQEGPNRKGGLYRLPPLTAGTGFCPIARVYGFGDTYRGAGIGTPANDLLARNGLYYGTTYHGGANGLGAAFRLSPPHAGQTHWTYDLLHSFGSGPEGANPFGGVVADNQGRLYGMTFTGVGRSARGAVYRLSPPTPGQTEWSLRTIYRFDGRDGPVGRLLARTVNGAFTLFGTTAGGGIRRDQTTYGVAFRLAPPASGSGEWNYERLHNFAGDAEGTGPLGGLIADRSLRLYGTALAYFNSENIAGVAYRLSPPASGTGLWNYDVLYRFRTDTGEGAPVGPLIEDANGVLYGLTSGAAFKLTPRDEGGVSLPWNRAILHDFAADGPTGPQGALTPRREPDGSIALYGSTLVGGSADAGTVFRVTPDRPAAFPNLP